MFLQLFLLFIIAILIFGFFNGRYNVNYWKKRGVKFHEKNKVLGVFWDFMTTDRPVFKIMQDIYKEHRNEPAVGLGGMLTPNLLVIDPTNIQHVLQTDFQSFNHRGIDVNHDDHLADNILFMNGNKWKLVRQNMTPLFTSSKLKPMFYIMDKSASDFIDYLKQSPQRLKGDAFNSVSMYCCASIGASVFGIVSKSVFDSPFLAIAKRAVSSTFFINLKFITMNLSPWLGKLLDIRLFAEYEDFFIGAIKRIIRQREQESGKKHDFADMCVALQKGGTLRDRETGLELEPTDELLAGQAFFFFIAGVEPSATAIFACLLELGRHPDHLRKVHEEIDAAFEMHNGKLTYETVMEMEYLEKVLCESMRLHPPIGFLTRKCVRDTILPVGNIKISNGTKVFTPIFDIHHDPKYYPNPEFFDPERFASEALRESSSLYMPFGKGNRLCVGVRYARLQVKTGLIHLLRNFSVKTRLDGNEIRYRKEQVQVRPINIDVEFIPRNIVS